MIDQQLNLPCGAVLPNRLAKAAMSEHLAEHDNTPGPHLQNLYRRWSRGGTGLLITGNVMIDRRSMESGRNVALEAGDDLAPFVAWARACTAAGNHCWMQINHPGRQTPRNINPEPVSASAVESVDMFRAVKAFGEPRALLGEEIADVIERYATTAAMARDAGFTGVQIHGAHGYLISQFLSPLTNQRDDEWGGSLENRARFAREVVRAVRKAVGPAFPVGIKLNSADFQHGGFNHEESVQVVQWLADDGVDLVELSGGSYEAQAMFALASEQPQPSEREAYFLDHARAVRRTCDVPLMVTGGFRQAASMRQAIADNACDVIGMARPLAVEPDLSRDMLDAGSPGSSHGAQSMGLGGKFDFLSEGGYCSYQMHRMARGRGPLRTHVLYAMIANLGYIIADMLRLGWQRVRA